MFNLQRLKNSCLKSIVLTKTVAFFSFSIHVFDSASLTLISRMILGNNYFEVIVLSCYFHI